MEKDEEKTETAADDFTGFVIDDTVYTTSVTSKFKSRKRYIPADPKRLLCSIPGIVRTIYVKKGQRVKAWDHLLVIEAMKMENEILSPSSGTIKEIHAAPGEMVTKGQLLVEYD